MSNSTLKTDHPNSRLLCLYIVLVGLVALPSLCALGQPVHWWAIAFLICPVPAHWIFNHSRCQAIITGLAIIVTGISVGAAAGIPISMLFKELAGVSSGGPIVLICSVIGIFLVSDIRQRIRDSNR